MKKNKLKTIWEHLIDKYGLEKANKFYIKIFKKD